MILIADSGSTKTDWCILEGSRQFFFQTGGFNPFFISPQEMGHAMDDNFPAELDKSAIHAVYFYGSGCFAETGKRVAAVLNSIFTQALVEVNLDLLGSARALLGQKAGFVAILGTGTNSCLYNGEQITQNIDSLGFILGDEGSGAAMGKRLLADYIRDYMPEEVRMQFAAICPMDKEQIFQRIYSEPKANRFCASFAPFLLQEPAIGQQYKQQLIYDAFTALFRNLVTHYPSYEQHSFNCTGSIGYYFRDILAKVAQKYGMSMGRIISSPMEGLIRFHMNRPSEGVLI